MSPALARCSCWRRSLRGDPQSSSPRTRGPIRRAPAFLRCGDSRCYLSTEVVMGPGSRGACHRARIRATRASPGRRSIEPNPRSPRPRGPAAREGVFMQRWFWAAAALLVAYPAFAANVATCTLGADRKTVTVTASDPYAQVMACEVNCHMDLARAAFATVVCVRRCRWGRKRFRDVHGCQPAMATPIRRVKDTRGRLPGPVSPAGRQQDRNQKGR